MESPTIAKEVTDAEKNTIIVSSDSIREELTGKVEDQSKNEEVFKIFHKRIRDGLENKYNVIADATNITMKSRRAILLNVRNLDVHRVAYFVPKPFEQCKVDNLHREHPIPEEVLDKQIRKFQIPFAEEGFDECFLHVFNKKNRLNEYNVAALLHDYGKLFCKTIADNGVAHFYGHESIGSYLVLENMQGLCWEDIMDTCFLINYHMMPFAWTTPEIQQRWKERFGEYKYRMLMDFHECDITR